MNDLAHQIREEARTRQQRRAWARYTGQNHPLDLEIGGASIMPDRGPADTRPYAVSADPCARCATRGTLGCAHQKPYQIGSN